jgi:putative ABC transport system permease protein
MNWLARLLNKQQLESELRKELEFHLERQTADSVRKGLSEEEARREASVRFGGIEQIRNECREARGTAWLEAVVRDIRLAIRVLSKSPGFVLTAILTLALGIGANGAIFQLLDAVRLRSLPVKDPQSLVLIHVDGENHRFGISSNSNALSYAVWQELERHQEGFSGVFAWADANIQIGTGNDKKSTHSVWVSSDTFSTLGVTPVRGRLFTSSDDRPGCGITGAVISEGFWKAQFGGSESAIGSVVLMDDHPTQILGVTPARFAGIEVGKSFDVALPLCSLTSYHPASTALARSDFSFLTVMGRIRPGWTLTQASDQLRSISPAIFQSTQPTGYAPGAHDFYKNLRLRAYPAANGISDLRGTYDSALWLLLGITGLVLLIACANIASLMLVRATVRQTEMAVRLAIGASRFALVRQLFTEALLIALVGAGVGMGVEKLLSKGLVLFLGGGKNAPYLDMSLDWRVLGFLASVTSLTCLIFGLIPGFRASQTTPVEAIKSRGQRGSAGRSKFSLQKVLVAAQIAISMVLVVGAVCFVRSFTSLMTLDAGFDRDNLIVASVDFSHVSMPGERNEAYLESLVTAVQALPQVRAAAAATHVPLDGSSWSLGIRVGEKDGWSKYTWVTSGYFRTLGMHLLAGRNFSEQDTATSLPVVIVNQTFVRNFVNGPDPVGQTVLSRAEPNYPATRYQIIGVVNDARYSDLKDEIPPQAFVPESQFTAGGPGGILFVRGRETPTTVIPAVRDKLRQIAPQMRTEFDLLESQVEDGLVRERLMAALSGFFGALAVILAAIGLYGLIAYLVAGRTNEIGIRLALGASRRIIAWHIVREAALLVCLGLVPGILLAMFALRSARSLLFGFSSSGWTSFGAASLFLFAVASGASWLPARRASRLDPMKALRSE